MPPATSATHLKLSTLVYRRELVVYLFMAIIKFPSTPLGFLQNWRLTAAEIDGFCHFWYNGILG